jgi:hypothetical protein
MNITSENISEISSAITAITSIFATIGVWFAFKQLKISRDIAQLEFEDGLSKEFRELASNIPTKALLGHTLSDAEYEEAFDELFRYFDLSNEQVSLRQRGRICKTVWKDWSEGIQANLKLPAFERAWVEIQKQCESFQGLRRLESEEFAIDPESWK